MIRSRIPPPYRELAHRFNDGLEVTLFWQKLTDELTITVSDERRGDYFELTAAPDEALNVFNHPYAYAEFRRLANAETLLPYWTEAAETN